MGALLVSLREFLIGVLQRFWMWIWTFALDPFEIYNSQIRSWPWTPGRQLDMPSEWFAPLFVGFIMLAGGMTYHALRQRAGANPPPQKPLTLLEVVDAFIAEGKSLQAQTMVPGAEPATALAENWRMRVEEFLEASFGKTYLVRWGTTIFNQPRRGFSGAAMSNNIRLWEGIEAALDFLADLGNELEGVKP